MALEDLTPVTRMESILDGDNISPVTRMEYFLGKAANEVPKPDGVSDAGKVLTVNAAGDGFELDTPGSGLPAYTGSDLGKVLTVGGTSENPSAGWEAASGLPEYTTADMGKVLTVGEGSESETVVIVPEQTVVVETAQTPTPVTGADTSYFTVGQQATLIVGGNEYSVTAVEMSGGSIAFPELTAGVIIGLMNGNVVLMTQQTGNFTISLITSIPSVEPKWETAGGFPQIPTADGTYDLVVDNGAASWALRQI